MTAINEIIPRLSESPPRIPAWLHVDKNTIKPVLQVLTYWSTDRSKTTAGVISSHNYTNPFERLLSMPKASFGALGDPIQYQCEAAGRSLDTLAGGGLRAMASTLGMVGASDAKVKEVIKSKREPLIETMVRMNLDGNLQWGLENEAEWYKIVKVFVPPAALWHLHPGFDYFRQMIDTKASTSKLKIVSVIFNLWQHLFE